ncbi:MAG: GNAT family N-acetyltransferase [Gammaproteobacteria bacterium]|jgi:ribosomal protein S18 acetylase RimI-like enzyme|nr:GNAT family N-acetyltransferase [Gammaproteobacteria bacterium]MDH5173277.1 GNAT family N-acetyltransferase [Gammaproteobacteria bacterium]
MQIKVVRADYLDPQQAADIVFLLNRYACDPMGGGEALAPRVQQDLVASLAALPHAVSLLCYVDGKPAGLVNCFEGFSTFSCKKLLNIHDIAVLEEFRGLGLSQLLLAEVEAVARHRGCGKLTLEVLEGNEPAKAAYKKFGFDAYQLDPALGQALFWQKPLQGKE